MKTPQFVIVIYDTVVIVCNKNSLLGGLNIQKTELYVKQKDQKIWGAFLSRLADSLTKSSRSGISATKDRASALIMMS